MVPLHFPHFSEIGAFLFVSDLYEAHPISVKKKKKKEEITLYDELMITSF